MNTFTRTLALAVAVVMLVAPAAHAQDFHRNSYGMYAAPTIYGFTNSTDYDAAGSGAGLDLGLYYSRAFTAGFSARLEARYGTRDMDVTENNDLFPNAYFMFRLSEQVLEIPLVLQVDRRIPFNDHQMRVSVGGGFSWKYVLDQKLLVPGGEVSSDYFVAADSYQRLGFLVDGGVTFDVNRKSAVFARLRYDVDFSTMSEPDDADVIRRFWEAGIYAGFEYGF